MNSWIKYVTKIEIEMKRERERAREVYTDNALAIYSIFFKGLLLFITYYYSPLLLSVMLALKVRIGHSAFPLPLQQSYVFLALHYF